MNWIIVGHVRIYYTTGVTALKAMHRAVTFISCSSCMCTLQIMLCACDKACMQYLACMQFGKHVRQWANQATLCSLSNMHISVTINDICTCIMTYHDMCASAVTFLPSPVEGHKIKNTVIESLVKYL